MHIEVTLENGTTVLVMKQVIRTIKPHTNAKFPAIKSIISLIGIGQQLMELEVTETYNSLKALL